MLATDGRILADAAAVATKLGIRILDMGGAWTVRPEPQTSRPGSQRPPATLGTIDFATIWERHVMPLAGATLSRPDGSSNTIVKVDWSGVERITSNGERGRIKIEIFKWAVDRFDRLLRYVWLTDGAAWTLVSLELVRQGVASAKSYPPDVRYDDLYRVAEADAQRAALGLWSPTPAPPTPASTPEPTPAPTTKPASKCHPSYNPCLPIVADLDCPDVRAMGKAPVDVIGPDDYRLDGNHDGVGCE